MEVRVEENILSPEMFRELFHAVGWEPPSLHQIKCALAGSLRTFSAYDSEEVAGMARLLGDGAMSYYIKDFAVRPDCQRKGIGRTLLHCIEASILRDLEPGWAVSLELISAKGREGFYEKLGFETRPSAWDGAGMFKMLRK